MWFWTLAPTAIITGTDLTITLRANIITIVSISISMGMNINMNTGMNTGTDTSIKRDTSTNITMDLSLSLTMDLSVRRKSHDHVDRYFPCAHRHYSDPDEDDYAMIIDEGCAMSIPSWFGEDPLLSHHVIQHVMCRRNERMALHNYFRRKRVEQDVVLLCRLLIDASSLEVDIAVMLDIFDGQLKQHRYVT
ncbi:hypothetical protein M406DRAFT_331592 [Cryphonectria parasitica EP155]|uniref:Uncharacterized protein n=1 Tax=Cryphonectria parasitica (strain ATCC 38755 / EP155) TaxID=660469 RepID=A0A9P4XY20_CRYP1|nr:uncharacterized protein M406DRAFT_331592 [Cryphonectria parasitica EP155]KAF3763021.1 hypothetical protein M406DRAFT_331592 [Cryphonectria parasitica EP155]